MKTKAILSMNLDLTWVGTRSTRVPETAGGNTVDAVERVTTGFKAQTTEFSSCSAPLRRNGEQHWVASRFPIDQPNVSGPRFSKAIGQFSLAHRMGAGLGEGIR